MNIWNQFQIKTDEKWNYFKALFSLTILHLRREVGLSWNQVTADSFQEARKHEYLVEEYFIEGYTTNFVWFVYPLPRNLI